MKLLNIILSIYLLTLSCMPCADIEVNSGEHSIVENNSDKDKHSHDKENDLCSPFCVCNCCGAQVLSLFSEVTFDFNRITTIIKLPLPNYKSILSSNFYGSIWQPPQIV